MKKKINRTFIALQHYNQTETQANRENVFQMYPTNNREREKEAYSGIKRSPLQFHRARAVRKKEREEKKQSKGQDL